MTAILFWTAFAFTLSGQTSNQAQLLIAPTKADFGNQEIDSTSQPVEIVIKNRTGHPIFLEEVIASGIDFSVQNGCAEQLPPGSECKIPVRFKPAITGPRTGILEIVADGAAKPYFVPLSGTGVASVGPEGSRAGGSLPPFDGHENLASKEKR